jgi:hypothetical protein
LTLEVLKLKVKIFRFKMQNDLIWAYNQMAKKSKIDLWEIRGFAQILEIERPAETTSSLDKISLTPLYLHSLSEHLSQCDPLS